MDVVIGYVLGRLVDGDPHPGRGTNRFVDIPFPDPYVSPVHCAVWREEDGTHWIRDLMSTNGTWISRDGITWRVREPAPIMPGDTVIIGRTSIPWSRGVDYRNC
jgi:pSer/pThr/pTyr-binding forkhead associated (FHA) protein